MIYLGSRRGGYISWRVRWWVGKVGRSFGEKSLLGWVLLEDWNTDVIGIVLRCEK